ncbi:hypothetical protein [Mycobacterium sp. DL440]|uniref:hypothetical protein n=1 Tax=Mycobacterium sp. DL440 TaxID=2675523 RepID=UPI0035305056
MSSHDQRADLDRQVARLSEWAVRAGLSVLWVRMSVMDSERRTLRGITDPVVAAAPPWLAYPPRSSAPA